MHITLIVVGNNLNLRMPPFRILWHTAHDAGMWACGTENSVGFFVPCKIVIIEAKPDKQGQQLKQNTLLRLSERLDNFINLESLYK